VLALAGALLLVGGAACAAVAFGVVVAIVGPPLAVGMLLVGVVFAGALWLGPGSGRVNQMTRQMATRFSQREYAGMFVIGLCIAATAVLVAALLSTGPNWSPATGSPWRSGVLADVAGLL